MKFNQLAGRSAATFFKKKEDFYRALDMESAGEARHVIWGETGFFRDADDRWKWEIPDTELKLKDKWDKGFDDNGYAYLDQLIEHEELFENYPFLHSLEVRSENLEIGVGGEFYSSSGNITISNQLVHEDKSKEFLSTLSHEVQHAVQQFERFSHGWSTDNRRNKKAKNYLASLSQSLSKKVQDEFQKDESLFQALTHSKFERQTANIYSNYLKLKEYSEMNSPTRVVSHIRGILECVYYEPFTVDGKMTKAAHELNLMWYNMPKSNYKGRKTDFVRELCIKATEMLKDSISSSRFDELKNDKRQVKSILNATNREFGKFWDKAEGHRELERLVGNLEKFRTNFEKMGDFDFYRHVGGEVGSRAVQNRLGKGREWLSAHNPVESYDVQFSDIVPIIDGRFIQYDKNIFVSDADYIESFLSCEEIKAKATIDFSGNHFAEVMLHPSADASSIIHESAHYFLEIYSSLNLRDLVNLEIKDDFSQVLDWMGVEAKHWYSMSPEEKEPYHEMFAEAFEDYVATNKSPLSNVFEKFKTWLNNICNSVIEKELTPVIGLENIFDKLTTTRPEVSAFEKSLYKSVESSLGNEIAEATKHMHDASISYFSKASGLPVSDLTSKYDLEIKSELKNEVKLTNNCIKK